MSAPRRRVFGVFGEIALAVVLAIGATAVASAQGTDASDSSSIQSSLLASTATAEGCAEPQFILDQPGVSGQPFAFSGDMECLPGGDEFSSPVIEWGDGATSPGVIGTVEHQPSFSSVGVSGQHIYSGPGMFCIRAHVTDDETGQVLSGAWHMCADISSPGVVPVFPPPAPTQPAAPTLSGLMEAAKTWREGNALADVSAEPKKPPLGTTFSFSLNVPANMTFAFTESASGRKVGTTCVAATKKNRNKRHCTRTVDAGALTFSAHAGTNKVRFEGRVSKHMELKLGSYTLLATATASGMHSTTRALQFTIAKG